MADQAQPAVRVAGLPPGVAPGPLGTRFLAYLIDSVVATLIGLLPAVLIWYTNLSPNIIAVVASLLLLAWVLLVWWMFAVGGAGPGMRLMHLQLVGLANGRPVGWGRFFLRQLILFGLGLTGIGLVLLVIFLIQHPRRQGWHDLAVTSVVIKERQFSRSRPAAQPRHADAPTAAQHTSAQASPSPVNAAPSGPPSGYPSPQASPTYGPVSSARAGGPAPQYGPAGRFSGPPPSGPPPSGPPPSSPTAQPLQSPPSDPPLRGFGPADPSFPPGRQPTSSAGVGTWRAVLDDGREIAVDGLVLLGRNPSARPSEDHASLIKIVDTTRTVSKSHLEIGLNSYGLYVVDRGSTNGSTVTSISGATKRCAPGDPVQVEPGSIVSFGDHWMEIRRDG